MEKVFKLLQALKDKEKFDKLTLEEKLEALRLNAIQRPESPTEIL